MDPRMYSFAMVGDITTLYEFYAQDEDVVETAADGSKGNPLHVAARLGHADFVSALWSLNPELATEGNEAGLTPLHLASAKGHVAVVKVLLAVDPDLSLLKDKQGRVPAHMAAIRGRVDVLREIALVHPWCLRERTDKAETILHLSVKKNMIEVVKFLMGNKEVRRMVNEGDCHGNTALHLAAARSQKEMIKILINSRSNVNLNAKNMYNISALELIRLKGLHDEIANRIHCISTVPLPWASYGKLAAEPSASNSAETRSKLREARIKQSENMMIVAVLIATVTFQAAITPPGSFWQDDSIVNGNSPSSGAAPSSSLLLGLGHRAGTAILNHKDYDKFMGNDVCAFVSSLLVILLQLTMKTAVFPDFYMLLGQALNVLIAIMYLGFALYYAIKATKPEFSAADQIIITQVLFVSLGCFVGAVAVCIFIKVKNMVKKLLRRA